MERRPASSRHQPVMVSEVLDGLAVQADGRYIDCTVGLGGHAEAILKAGSPSARVLGLDLDPAALDLAQERLDRYGDRALLVEGNFSQVA